MIGAGSIVRDAHLPVYRRLGFPIAGIYDVSIDAARERASVFGVARVFGSLAEAAATPDAIFDLALPPSAIAGTIEHLPASSFVLIQKPLGRDLAEAVAIREICWRRSLTAAVNFQLRFAPNMLVLRKAVSDGLLGEITDVEVRVNLLTPWQYWEFLRGVPRLEVLMHSIHYLDLIRGTAGEPRGVYCRGVRYPGLDAYADVRTSIILDYGDALRCSLVMNHTHDFGSDRAVSEIKVEGTKACVVARMGVNLNYPHGEPDEILVAERGQPNWRRVPLRGSWFLEGFEGPMSNLQRVARGEDDSLVSGIDDAVRTMALVEACYTSSSAGGTPIPEVP
jgi:predicted dehydrogenase